MRPVLAMRGVARAVAGAALLAAALCSLPAAAAGTEEAAWAALAAGDAVILMRHAATEEGVGDPPGFRKDDCSTQRNLSAAGRESAQKIGAALRERGIRIGAVWSSRWCRCLDTARLAFGRVESKSMLDSLFNDPEGGDEEKLRALRQALRQRPGGGNLVLVTHNVNIRRLTGISTAAGEMVVARADSQGKLSVSGRLQADR
ncbi:MAG: histidine phosphatase family protein [Paucimonas sp.]|nr:histidine phosphatase family protein [Paucimonas sp.]